MVATSPKYAMLSIAIQCVIEHADNYPKLISNRSILPASSYTASFSSSAIVNETTNRAAIIPSESALAHIV